MKYRLPHLLLITPIALGTVLAACSDSTSSNAKPNANVSIVVGASTKTFTAFQPDTFTVSLAGGGKVIWRNDDALTHTATADDPADVTAGINTGNVAPGAVDTLDFSGFTAPDTVKYHCSIHNGMVGAIAIAP